MFWTTAAYAMGAPAGGAEGQPSFLISMAPIILMFAIFYFLLIRPQQKRAKEMKAMIASLKRGDEVLTAGGLYGRIVETAEDYVVVDLGKTEVKVSRSAISGVMNAPRAASDKKGKKGEGKDARSGAADAPADNK